MIWSRVVFIRVYRARSDGSSDAFKGSAARGGFLPSSELKLAVTQFPSEWRREEEL